MSNIVMMVGFPASGKTQEVYKYVLQGYQVLSRDKEGGNVIDLLPKMEQLIAENKDVVLDCTFVSPESRKPFIDAAISKGCRIDCHWVSTSVDDCQINALMRMYDRYGKCFLHPNDFKDPVAKKGPNMFPITVLFHMKKEFKKPDISEGFTQVIQTKFVRKYRDDFKQKALFIDYDGTIRDVPEGAEFKYPTKKSEVVLICNRSILQKYKDDGYIIIGASNQSGIGKKVVTEEVVKECFCETNRQLGMDIEVNYCPHNVPPVCYCRKPQSGLFIPAIMRHKIDIKNSIFVGDQTTDETAAKRLGMKFINATEFFKTGE